MIHEGRRAISPVAPEPFSPMGAAGDGADEPAGPGEGVTALLEILDRPSPATDVRMMLCLYRSRGYGFEQAWSHTLRALPRVMPGIEEWRTLLHRNKHVWKAAYEQGG